MAEAIAQIKEMTEGKRYLLPARIEINNYEDGLKYPLLIKFPDTDYNGINMVPEEYNNVPLLYLPEDADTFYVCIIKSNTKYSFTDVQGKEFIYLSNDSNFAKSNYLRALIDPETRPGLKNLWPVPQKKIKRLLTEC